HSGTWGIDGGIVQMSIREVDVKNPPIELVGAILLDKGMSYHRSMDAFLDIGRSIAIIKEPTTSSLQVQQGDNADYWCGIGPTWVWERSFLNLLQHPAFKGVTSTTTHGEFDGFAVEWNTLMASEARLDIAYDMSIGGLPRFIRRVTFEAEQTPIVCEWYLTRVHSSPNGSFIPLQSLGLQWSSPMKIDSLEGMPRGKFPHEGKVVGVFIFNGYEVSETPPSLKIGSSKGFSFINAGGRSQDFSSFPKELSANDLFKTTDRMLRLPAVVSTNPPELSLAEMNKFAPSPGPSWMLYAAVTLTLAGMAAIVYAFFRRRNRLVVLVIATCGVQGCGAGESKINLSADFSASSYLVDTWTDKATAELVVSNPGGVDVVLTGAGVRCGCVKIKAEQFPMTIPARSAARLSVPVAARIDGAAQAVALNLQTNFGELAVQPIVRVLPKWSITPDSLHLGRKPSGHRFVTSVRTLEIIPSNQEFEAVTLVADSIVECKRDTVRIGVGPTRDFRFRETDYQILIKPDASGYGTADVRLSRDRDSEKLCHAHMQWDLTSGVTAVPSKVYLADKPVKVRILADGDVEITDVTSSSNLVCATKTEGRILTVAVNPEAPEDFQTEIEIKTSGPEKSSLKIPVTRWKPTKIATTNPSR
ncbi:MAG: hypothetical protein ACRDD1_14255, partial [Planctomycetia bacterium]